MPHFARHPESRRVRRDRLFQRQTGGDVLPRHPVAFFQGKRDQRGDPRNRRLGRDRSVGRDGRRHLRYRQLRRHAGDQRAEGGRKSALLGSGDDLQPIVVGRETSDPVAIAVPHRIGRAQPRHEVRAAEPAARKNRRGDPHPAGHEESDDPSAGSGRLEFDPCRD